jgi:hypothetical protein
MNNGNDNRPNDRHAGDAQLDDDIMHGLLCAEADEARAFEQADAPPPLPYAPARRLRAPLAALASAAAMLTLALLVLLPVIGPQVANASEIVREAERSLVASGPRTYDVRITRWGGPFELRLVSGEVTYRPAAAPGTPPTTEGFLLFGERDAQRLREGVDRPIRERLRPQRRLDFGRDADGAWYRGPDGTRWARPIARDIMQGDEEAPSGEDLDAMTLDALLSKLSQGYALEVLGSHTMRAIIAKRKPATRFGPARVELELAEDGRTIERAVMEIDRGPHATTIELRLRAASAAG